MKVALVYDRVNKWGGAERVLLALHKLFPKAPLYTSVYNKKTADWAKVFDVRYSFLQYFPGASFSHEYYALLMPLAFESFYFDEYDLVISVTSEAAKGIITSSKTLHLCYCLTPTRYLWSGYNEYFKSTMLRLFSKPAVSYLKSWDLKAAKRPDHYIAISQVVQQRIKKYYQKDADVIYPPLLLMKQNNTFGKLSMKKKVLTRKDGYFLIVSRLVSYKSIDIAIKACNRLQVPLKIVGTGSDETRLKSLAGPTIEFLGFLTDEKLVEYYRGCKALIFPGVEDFGLTAIEAQSLGKPVIAYKDGGLQETVIDGKTGLFFYPKTEKGLVQALQSFSHMKFSEDDCQKQAALFSMKQFETKFLKEIEKLRKNKKTL